MKQKINIAILLLLSLLPLVLQGVATSGNMAPTIRELDYRELESMNGVLPPNSVIIAEFRIGYWVQYITRSDISKRPSPQLRQNFDHVLLLIDKFSPRKPHVPLKSTKLFEGNRFILYELP